MEWNLGKGRTENVAQAHGKTPMIRIHGQTSGTLDKPVIIDQLGKDVRLASTRPPLFPKCPKSMPGSPGPVSACHPPRCAPARWPQKSKARLRCYAKAVSNSASGAVLRFCGLNWSGDSSAKKKQTSAQAALPTSRCSLSPEPLLALRKLAMDCVAIYVVLIQPK